MRNRFWVRVLRDVAGGEGGAAGGAAGSGGEGAGAAGAGGGEGAAGSGAGTTLLGAAEGAGGAGGAGEPDATAVAEAARVAALTPEARAAEEKAATDKAAKDAEDAKGAPETYAEFKAPEGTVLQKEVLDVFAVKAKELNLSQGKAQELLDWYAKEILPQNVAQQHAAWEKTTQDWAAASKVDKEIGGDKFDANISLAQRALNTFASPELGKYIVDSGLGNHPEFIRLMVRVGKSMSEDSFIKGNLQGQKEEPNEKATLRAMYPTMHTT